MQERSAAPAPTTTQHPTSQTRHQRSENSSAQNADRGGRFNKPPSETEERQKTEGRRQKAEGSRRFPEGRNLSSCERVTPLGSAPANSPFLSGCSLRGGRCPR